MSTPLPISTLFPGRDIYADGTNKLTYHVTNLKVKALLNDARFAA